MVSSNSSYKIVDNQAEKTLFFFEPKLLDMEKLEGFHTLDRCDNIAISPQFTIIVVGFTVHIIGTNRKLDITELVEDLAIIGNTINILFKSSLQTFEINNFSCIRKIDFSHSFKKIKHNKSNFALVSNTQICVFEGDSQCDFSFNSESSVTDFEYFPGASENYLLGLNRTKLCAYSLNREPFWIFTWTEKFHRLCIISKNIVILYNQEKSNLTCIGIKENQAMYRMEFSSKLQKELSFCEDTGELVVMNKQAKSMFFFSFDGNWRICGCASFGVNATVRSMRLVYIDAGGADRTHSNCYRIALLGEGPCEIYEINFDDVQAVKKLLEISEIHLKSTMSLMETASNFSKSELTTQDSYKSYMNPVAKSEQFSSQIESLKRICSESYLTTCFQTAFSLALPKLNEINLADLFEAFPTDFLQKSPDKFELLLQSEKHLNSLLSEFKNISKPPIIVDLPEAIRNWNDYELKNLLNKLELSALSAYDLPKFFIEMAFKLISLIENGYKKGLRWLEEICRKCKKIEDFSMTIRAKLITCNDWSLRNCVKLLDS